MSQHITAQSSADERLQPVNMAFYKDSFVSGRYNENRIELRYFFRPADGHMFGELRFGAKAEGPPGYAHGGALAAVLDEQMGVMAWFNKRTVVTANLNVDFRELLPLSTPARVDTWIERVDGRKIYTRGRIVSGDGIIHSEARGLFIELAMEHFGARDADIRHQYGL